MDILGLQNSGQEFLEEVQGEVSVLEQSPASLSGKGEEFCHTLHVALNSLLLIETVTYYPLSIRWKMP